MNSIQNWPLAIAGGCSFAAALLHVGCILGGPAWYRFFGAGERMATMAARGYWTPTVLTSFITVVLALWGCYAWSGAGILRPLPLLRLALCGITAVYLLRAVGFVALQPHFPENSQFFWYWTSSLCLAIALLHLTGLYQSWSRL